MPIPDLPGANVMRLTHFQNKLMFLFSISAFVLSVSRCPAEPTTEVGQFDGAKSIITLQDPHQGEISKLTLSVWVRVDKVSPQDAYTSQAFITRGDYGSMEVDNRLSYSLDLHRNQVRMRVRSIAGPRMEGAIWERNTSAKAPGNALADWAHIAGVFDSKTLRLYINGQMVHEVKAAGPIPASHAPVIVGARAPFADVVKGSLADVAIWEEAFCDEQIATIYAKGFAEMPERLVQLSGESLRESIHPAAASEEFGYQLSAVDELPVADGFRGIWYANQPSKDEYRFKYSGGKATYPHQHTPIAIYSPEVKKTFFVYGGSYRDRNMLLHMVSYFDHKTGLLARPRILLDKRTDDAHDNPTICIDGQGYIYIFSSAHGTWRPSYIHRSTRPYDISSFRLVKKTNFSYTQPWFVDDHNFVFMHTRYQKGRALFVMQSDDGIKWKAPQLLARIGKGHYQVTNALGNKVCTAFNYHPSSNPGGLNYRTNLYYMETVDGGKSWKNAAGVPVSIPLTKPENPTLVAEYKSQGLNCYMKCVRWKPDGRPVILHLTSGGYQSGPKNNPRMFRTAAWTGKEWVLRDAMPADNNYDYGFLDFLPNGDWQITGTTLPGPQKFNAGGEIAIWTSSNEGRNWKMTKQLTLNSPHNHCYPRRPLNANPDFNAIWADGHGRQLSESKLYFTDFEGSTVWQMPTEIRGNQQMVKPIRISE